MRIKTVNIEPDVAAVIRAAKLDGNKLTLNGQLTAQMYKKVMKVLELIGFKWNRSAKCHIGEGDSAAKLTEALSVGTVVNEKQTYQFFETPTQVAAKIAALAGIKPGDRVLEPSAGKGAIIRAIQQECPQLAVVFACELNPQMASDLSTLAAASRIAGHGDVVVTCEDFLDHEEKYDRIVMNPPFTQDQAVRHVKHAYDLLNPGGAAGGDHVPLMETQLEPQVRDLPGLVQPSCRCWAGYHRGPAGRHVQGERHRHRHGHRGDPEAAVQGGRSVG